MSFNYKKLYNLTPLDFELDIKRKADENYRQKKEFQGAEQMLNDEALNELFQQATMKKQKAEDLRAAIRNYLGEISKSKEERRYQQTIEEEKLQKEQARLLEKERELQIRETEILQAKLGFKDKTASLYVNHTLSEESEKRRKVLESIDKGVKQFEIKRREEVELKTQRERKLKNELRESMMVDMARKQQDFENKKKEFLSRQNEVSKERNQFFDLKNFSMTKRHFDQEQYRVIIDEQNRAKEEAKTREKALLEKEKRIHNNSTKEAFLPGFSTSPKYSEFSQSPKTNYTSIENHNPILNPIPIRPTNPYLLKNLIYDEAFINRRETNLASVGSLSMF